MSKVTFEQMLNAGVHFGHLKRKWNPSMSPYIFDEKKGILAKIVEDNGEKLYDNLSNFIILSKDLILLLINLTGQDLHSRRDLHPVWRV